MVEDIGSAASADARAARTHLHSLLDAVSVHDVGIAEALAAMCRVAVDALDLTGAVISLMTASRSGGVASGAVVAFSDENARIVEELEFSNGEGPGRDAFTLSRPVLTSDLEQASSQWPAYGPAALMTRTRASFAFPMHVGAVRLGAFHFHCSQPRLLSAREIASCLMLTDMATEIVLNAPTPLSDNELANVLTRDPGTRDQIYQAQGMISVQLRISLTDALARMRAHAFASGQELASLSGSLLSGNTHLPGDFDERQ